MSEITNCLPGCWLGIPMSSSDSFASLPSVMVVGCYSCSEDDRDTEVRRSDCHQQLLSVISQYGGSPSPVYCSTAAVVTWKIKYNAVRHFDLLFHIIQKHDYCHTSLMSEDPNLPAITLGREAKLSLDDIGIPNQQPGKQFVISDIR